MSKNVVDYNLVVAADVLLSSCMEIYELIFSMCSAWWNREFLNLVLLSSGISVGGTGSRSWLFALSALKRRLLSTSYVFDFTLIVCVFDTSDHSGACRTDVLESSLKVPASTCHGLSLNVSGYPLNLFLNRQRSNIHSPDLMYDEEMCSTLSKQSKCEKTC